MRGHRGPPRLPAHRRELTFNFTHHETPNRSKRLGQLERVLGTRKVIEFGTREDEAREWVTGATGFEWTRIEDGPLTGSKMLRMEAGDPDGLAFADTPHVAFGVVVGGRGMPKIALMVRARTARRADQWALARVRCRFLNRKGQPIEDRRKIWVESRHILTLGER